MESGHLNYPWKATYYEKPFWPDGTRMVVLLNSEYEAIRHVPPLPNGTRDFRQMGLNEFEARAGVWRILDILDKFDLSTTFFVNGATAEEFPESVAEIQKKGHEIAAHGYQAENLWELDEDEERRLIQKVGTSISNVTGERPSGWLTPVVRQSEKTMEILADEQYLWNSDLFDSELPYLIEVGQKKILEIPRSFTSDDIMLPFTNPRAMYEAWRDEFDFLYKESLKAPKMLLVQWHQYITGRPSRAKALEDLLEHIVGHDGIWFPRNTELAEFCLANW